MTMDFRREEVPAKEEIAKLENLVNLMIYHKVRLCNRKLGPFDDSFTHIPLDPKNIF